jgi:hypothetical protein
VAAEGDGFRPCHRVGAAKVGHRRGGMS